MISSLFVLQPREVEDAVQVEGIVRVEVNPEQRLLPLVEGVAVELLVLLLRAVLGRLEVEGVGGVEHLRRVLVLMLVGLAVAAVAVLVVVRLLLLLVLRRIGESLDAAENLHELLAGDRLFFDQESGDLIKRFSVLRQQAFRFLIRLL